MGRSEQTNNYTRIWKYFLYAIHNGVINEQNIGIISLMKYLVFHKRKFEIVDKDSQFFYYISYNRKDYLNLLMSILDQIKLSKSAITVTECKIVNISFIIKLIRNLNMISRIKIEMSTMRIDDISSKGVFIVYLKTLELLDMCDKLSIPKNCKGFVVLCDVWPEECALVDEFNKRNIPTVTLQHALFLENPQNGTFDVLNYQDVPSKYQIVWGEQTKQLLRKYHNCSDVKICGNPILSMNTIWQSVDDKLYGVVLDSGKYKSQNQQMINIITEYAVLKSGKVKLRIHPTDSKENYFINNCITEWDSDLYDCNFIIAHTSTMLITYMIEGKKVFCFKSDAISWPINNRLKFSSLKELSHIYDDTRESFDFIKEGKRFISLTGTESLKKYKYFFGTLGGQNEN